MRTKAQDEKLQRVREKQALSDNPKHNRAVRRPRPDVSGTYAFFGSRNKYHWKNQ